MGNTSIAEWIDRAEPDAVVMVFDHGQSSREAIDKLLETSECPKQLRRWFEQAKSEIESGGDGRAWIVIMPLDGGSGGFERLQSVGDLEPNDEQLAGAIVDRVIDQHISDESGMRQAIAGHLALNMGTKGTA